MTRKTVNLDVAGIFLVSLLAALSLLSEPVAAVDITSCTNMTTDGEAYSLTNDINDNGNSTCMNITADNVTLDCQGYLIDGIDSANSRGIKLYQATVGFQNTTVKNCRLSDWHSGVYISSSNNNTVINTTYDGTGQSEACAGIWLISSDYNNITEATLENCDPGNGEGIYIQSGADYNTFNDVNASFNRDGIWDRLSDGNTYTNVNVTANSQYGFISEGSNVYIGATFRDSVIINNSVCGIYIDGAKNTKIYNNLINNSNNACFAGTLRPNYFNTTQASGTRTYSDGTDIAGNYWTDADGSYSDTCTDSDTDGFCDSPYNVSTGTSCTQGTDCDVNRTDYLPLSDEYVESDTTSPTITIESPENKTYGSGSIDYNITVNENLTNAFYSLDSGANETMTNDTSAHYYNLSTGHTATSEGTHNITFYANDTAGNINSTTLYFTVDTITPNITEADPANNTEITSSRQLRFNVNDTNLDSAWFDNGNGTNTTFTSNATFSPGFTTEGSNNITIYANDTAANNMTAVTYYYTVDDTAPTITMLRHDRSCIEINHSLMLTWTQADTNTIFESFCNYTSPASSTYKVSSATTSSASCAFSLNETGSWTINVTVNDTAGNSVIRTEYADVRAAGACGGGGGNGAPYMPPEINETPAVDDLPVTGELLADASEQPEASNLPLWIRENSTTIILALLIIAVMASVLKRSPRRKL